MREQILKLKAIGRMPTESDADDNDEKIDELIEQYDELISSVERPITLEEAEVLVSLFPDVFSMICIGDYCIFLNLVF